MDSWFQGVKYKIMFGQKILDNDNGFWFQDVKYKINVWTENSG